MLAFRFSRRLFSISKPEEASLFDSFNFPESIKKSLLNMNFTKPTPIQSESWPAALSGKDLVGIAETGSGKTLAYSVPSIIHMLKANKNVMKVSNNQPPLGLILLPTRELSKQVSEQYIKFGASSGIKVATVYGGDKKSSQIQQIRYGIHTLIGTPGRILDFMSSDILDVSHISFLVLDEADLMLDMGFEDQMRKIIHSINVNHQTLMFTATWPKEIQSLAQEFLKDPVKIVVGNEELTMNKDISHFFTVCDDMSKQKLIIEKIREDPSNKILIFTNTKREANELGSALNRHDLKCDVLHSDKEQFIRNVIIRDFRNGRLNILIATDVASRGLDIKNVGLVLNYSLPRSFDDYIHRVGRTGRAGNKGTALSFIDPGKDINVLRRIKNALYEIDHPIPNEIRNIK